MMKKHHEIVEAEALKNKYKDGRVAIINCQTNKAEYMCVVSSFF